MQRQQLEDEVNLSTIELSFAQPEKIREQIVEDIDGKMQSEQSVNFLPRLSDNLKAGWLHLMEFLLFISQLWAFILGLILVWWIWRWLSRRLAVNRPIVSDKTTTTQPTLSQSQDFSVPNNNMPDDKDTPSNSE